jgi:hypothetical protein
MMKEEDWCWCCKSSRRRLDVIGFSATGFGYRNGLNIIDPFQTQKA